MLGFKYQDASSFPSMNLGVLLTSIDCVYALYVTREVGRLVETFVTLCTRMQPQIRVTTHVDIQLEREKNG